MPMLLDLYCCAGGAAKGYADAGFTVVGVDIEDQPHYPYDFILGDALDVMRRLLAGDGVRARSGRVYQLSDFAAIHASPPCQKYSAMTKGRWKDREHPDLIEPTRVLLIASDLPYVIENVMGAPLLNAVKLCGTMFGLQTSEGSQLRRHRLFETSIWLPNPPLCQHNDGSPIGVYGGGQNPDRMRPATIAVFGNSGGASKRDGVEHYGVAKRREAMGIDWATSDELSQAIPPAYTEWIGGHLMGYLVSTGRVQA